MLHCKFSGDYNSERIFKIGQYLTKLCVEHLVFTFFGPPCIGLNHEFLHHRGESFVTSDVQLVNYTNIRSEGTDSR